MISATIAGNIGNAELKTTQSGKTVLNFTVASNNPRAKDAPPTWVRCALWGERGTKLAQYITKGKPVCVAGSLTTREYEGKTMVELDVADVKLMGGDGPGIAAPKPRRQSDDEIPF